METPAPGAAALTALYRRIRPDIEARLAEFAAVWARKQDAELWRELCFCLCTPQNDAERAWNAVLRLEEEGLLANGAEAETAAVLRACGVRFHNHKASYITRNRKTFLPKTAARLQTLIRAAGSVPLARDALAGSTPGWGLKEASHFLRNIGFGQELCILDRHILRRLAAHQAIAAIPQTLSAARYAETEQAMLRFAKNIRVPPVALDLLFWYEAKGCLFK